MNNIASEIKTIIESLGLIYLRCVNINDLNEQVGETSLLPGAGIYANVPSISNETYATNANVLMTYSIEIYFLRLNEYPDDNGEQIDLILDATKQNAEDFIDVMKKSALIKSPNFIETYELDAVETIKMSKEVLSGFQLSFDLPIYRADFFCP